MSENLCFSMSCIYPSIMSTPVWLMQFSNNFRTNRAHQKQEVLFLATISVSLYPVTHRIDNDFIMPAWSLSKIGNLAGL